MKHRIFVGSSSEKLKIARAIASDLSNDHEPTVWNEGIFDLSKDILSGLIDRLALSDAAVFVLGPDDVTRLRDKNYDTVRDNVIFELGLFIGRLGREYTYFVIPKGSSDLRLPTDLLGIVAAEYDSRRSDGNWRAAVAPACDLIREAIVKAQNIAQTRTPKHQDLLSEGVSWMQESVNKALKVFLTREKIPSLETSEIKATADSYSTRIGRTEVSVRFGHLQTCDATEPGHVVALPANEFFDDDCIKDTRSALGAYVQHAFAENVHELQQLISERLSSSKPELVEREPNVHHPSYGIAKCVYLHFPLGSRRKLIFVSVTTKRAGFGLRSEARYLFASMKAICNEMNDNRLTDLHMPLMGSGHGCIECELSLLYLLLALKNILSSSSAGAGLQSVCIVVFQKDDTTAPSVSREVAGRILSVVKSISH